MKIIRSTSDLTELDSHAFLEPILRFACILLQAIAAEVDPDDLEEHLLCHPIILCEAGDRIKTLLEVNPFGHEYVERLDLDGVMAFRIGVLLDNDWLAQYIVPAAGLDSESEIWLKEQCVTGGAER